MKKKTVFIHYLALFLLIGSMAACSSGTRETKGEVIRQTTTTVERPVIEETQTTTTTTERK